MFFTCNSSCQMRARNSQGQDKSLSYRDIKQIGYLRTRRRYPIIMKRFVLFWKGKKHKTQATIFTRDSELIFFYFSV